MRADRDRAPARFAGAVFLAFVLVWAAVSALGGAFTLFREWMSASDPQWFEEQLRRYTDGVQVRRGGEVRHVRSRFPAARLSGIVIALCGLAVMAGVALRRLLRPSRRTALFTLCAPLVVFAGLLLVFALLKPYQQERVRIFMHPERDPLGSGYAVTPVPRRSMFSPRRGRVVFYPNRKPFLPPVPVTATVATAAVLVGSAAYLASRRTDVR